MIDGKKFFTPSILFSCIAILLWPSAPLSASDTDTAHSPANAPKVLFIGNSYTMGNGSPVRYFHSHTITDLNGFGIGGVPALFKTFSTEAGRDFRVFLEAAPGMNLDYHFNEKANLLDRPWDYVVLQGFSTLDYRKPGDPTLLRRSAKSLAELLMRKNPKVNLHFVSTWTRADQTYPDSGHWHGQSIRQMALDIRKGYDLAASDCAPAAKAVIPVGEAWNRAMNEGVADPNPYDGISPGQLDLWTYDHHHASAYGYYLSALMIFGDLTGLDPRSLGPKERAAFELGFSAGQAMALQEIAFEELSAIPGRPPLRPFTPHAESQE